MSRRALAVVASLLGAALLFTVQPFVARLVLPRLGGSPTVWSTCQVFFQSALLLGYAYAYATTRWLSPRGQAALHLLVLASPLVALPIGIPAGWAPPGDADPTLSLLALLARAVLLPFAVVATTAPLVQRWYARSGAPDAAEPYSLYAASNVGSLAGLLGYPLLIEPALTLGAQGRAWAAGYVAFGVAVLACAWPSLRGTAGTDEAPAPPPDERPPGAPVTARRALRWVALSAAPSALLLGVTAHITTDVVSAPLLWALPLALYLATFIHAFARRPWVTPSRLAASLPVVVGLAAFMLAIGSSLSFPGQTALGLVVHLVALTAVCAACHGALAAERPDAAGLTAYYLLLSLGGVIGGLLGGLLPPLVLHSVAEYPAALVVSCALLADAAPTVAAPPADARRDRRPVFLALGLGVVVLTWRALVPALASGAPPPVAALLFHPALVPSLGVLGCVAFGWRRPRRFALALGAVLIASALDLGLLDVEQAGRVLEADRSFFGVHRAIATSLPPGRIHQLAHGTTLHGAQLADPATDRPVAPDEPLTYYSRGGPVGWTFAALAARPQGPPRRIALVGLGAGAQAAWFGPGQEATYFEIDPVVVRLAEDPRYFTYLAAARARGARIDIVLGDGRVTVGRAADGAFDLVILDAFSSDTVPAHLLTREAFATWMRVLAPGGLLLCHTTNRALQVHRIVAHVAAAEGLAARLAIDRDAPDPDAVSLARVMRSRSRWVVIARREADLAGMASDPRFEALPGDPDRAWTDDHSSILDLLRN